MTRYVPRNHGGLGHDPTKPSPPMSMTPDDPAAQPHEHMELPDDSDD